MSKFINTLLEYHTNTGSICKNSPINLDHVEAFHNIYHEHFDRTGIEFKMNSGKTFSWFFMNVEDRDAVYQYLCVNYIHYIGVYPNE